MAVTIDKTRDAWRCASAFSADKESVYPEHAAAHEFNEHSGKDVLEYGCGGGSDAMSYLRRSNRVTFADVVPFNVNTAKSRIISAGLGMDAHPLVLGNSAPIPLLDESFDVINSHGVLHHIESPELRDAVMQEFFRLLRPGGMVYVMLYSEHLRERLDARVVQLVTWRGLSEAEAFCWLTDEEGCPYARPYTDQEGRAYLETAGFRVVKSTLYNRNDFRTFKGIKE